MGRDWFSKGVMLANRVGELKEVGGRKDVSFLGVLRGSLRNNHQPHHPLYNCVSKYSRHSS